MKKNSFLIISFMFLVVEYGCLTKHVPDPSEVISSLQKNFPFGSVGFAILDKNNFYLSIKLSDGRHFSKNKLDIVLDSSNFKGHVKDGSLLFITFQSNTPSPPDVKTVFWIESDKPWMGLTGVTYPIYLKILCDFQESPKITDIVLGDYADLEISE